MQHGVSVAVLHCFLLPSLSSSAPYCFPSLYASRIISVAHFCVERIFYKIIKKERKKYEVEHRSRQRPLSNSVSPPDVFAKMEHRTRSDGVTIDTGDTSRNIIIKIKKASDKRAGRDVPGRPSDNLWPVLARRLKVTRTCRREGGRENQ